MLLNGDAMLYIKEKKQSGPSVLNVDFLIQKNLITQTEKTEIVPIMLGWKNIMSQFINLKKKKMIKKYIYNKII